MFKILRPFPRQQWAAAIDCTENVRPIGKSVYSDLLRGLVALLHAGVAMNWGENKKYFLDTLNLKTINRISRTIYGFAKL